MSFLAPFPGISVVTARLLSTANTQTAGTGHTSYSFSGQTLSTTDDWVVACFNCDGFSGSTLLSAVTIDGQSTTAIENFRNTGGSGRDVVAIYIAPCTHNATGTVAVTLTGGGGSQYLSMTLIGVKGSNGTPNSHSHTTGTGGTNSTTLNVPGGGCALGIAMDSSVTATTTWSGLTEVSDFKNTASSTHSAALANLPAGNSSLSVSATFTVSAVTTAAWAVFSP